LVKRAHVGLAIWGEDALLEKRLRKAEVLFNAAKEKDITKARSIAEGVLNDLEKLDFCGALQALASTCRTRGELGMLTTANARYGRYYATFIQRLAHILGKPLSEARGCGRWDGEEILTVFPVPNRITVDDTVSFDAILLPEKPGVKFQIELTDLNNPDTERKVLGLELLGGSYHRAVFFPSGEGAWAWKLAPVENYQRSEGSLPLANGVITIGP
jgi:hypothetical protein